ncbi:patatin-like phospholipase family protein [Candidatus Phycosocius spiralis]|uniref:Patatin n=1 Tax=Candidatus Phycosocius spiralis TaxID=2815099 RepID=A0ABQ4PSK6_9PROT|nr:patatin-like phospholipase family protein [Candidatus Phycosocius spiralis]GIU65989.1 patatin [Candidatus Phycosocius spiralis]
MTPKDFAGIPFLRDVGSNALKDVEKSAIWYSLPGGWPLFLEHEPAEALWFVRSGSLGAFRRNQDGSNEFIGHIRQGEPVGEMALVAGEAHSASVYALRDTELLALDRSTFNRLIHRHPPLMQNLARIMLFRSRQNRRRNPRSDPRVFGLISASSSIDIIKRAEALKDALHVLGKRAIVIGMEAVGKAASWFDDIERNYDIILLAADQEEGIWPKICLRQADRLWIFGRSDTAPPHHILPEGSSPARQFQLVDLILVGPQDRIGEMTTRSLSSAWLAASQAQRLFHWRADHIQDVMMLARILSGASVGLVLGGGGARAYAHIGVVRALRETGIAFDFVGGTSMGGVIAACVALGWDDGEIERHIWDGFVQSNPLNDYILPVVAMTSGRKVDQRLEAHFGDVLIEDLPRPFFCVSTNLTLGCSKLHRSGRLRDALRASIALPGILPPVVSGDDILVDGAVLDNFPINAMADLHRGPNIGVDVTRQRALRADEFRKPEGFLRWVSRHGIHSAPPIAELLMRSATASVDAMRSHDKTDLLILPDMQGIQLRDWKAYDAAVESGYKEAMRAIQNPPLVLKHHLN